MDLKYIQIRGVNLVGISEDLHSSFNFEMKHYSSAMRENAVFIIKI